MSEETRDAVQPLAVIDIDGVVADVRHRLHHVQRRPKDWPAFFAAATDDLPLADGVAVVGRLAEVCEIVYLSGRPERLRRVTAQWLEDHGLPSGELHLRPGGDFRPARQFKVEVLRTLRRRAPISVVVDDDEEVLAAVQAAGFDVLPARWMEESPAEADALHEAQEDEGRT